MNEIKIEADYDHYGNEEFTVTGLEQDTGVWLTVNSFSIRIRQRDVGLIIDVYGKGAEAEDALGELTVWEDDLPEGTPNEKT